MVRIDFTRTRPLRVLRRLVIADSVVALTLGDADGDELPTWTPGAHVELRLANGLVRQYSLCGDPADRRHYRIAVLREPGGRGGSRFLHDQIAVGDLIAVGSVRNEFVRPDRTRYRFIAGGIGITPILPMIAAAEAQRADWRLLYGGRRRASMAFLDELSGYGDRVTIAPEDEVGRLDLAGWLPAPTAGIGILCCGPAGLLAVAEEIGRTWPPETLHIERFQADDANPPIERRPFTVRLNRSGRTLPVPADKSVLEVLEAAAVVIHSSCREGICGTCETTVLAGVPEHHDSVLTEEERAANDVMCVCVSRAHSASLTLDL